MTLPLHLGSIPTPMGCITLKFGASVRPGDVFILNDPYEGGTHLPDFYIVKPVWRNHALIGWAATYTRTRLRCHPVSARIRGPEGDIMHTPLHAPNPSSTAASASTRKPHERRGSRFLETFADGPSMVILLISRRRAPVGYDPTPDPSASTSTASVEPNH
jgi:hypothetical protein